MTTYRLTPEAQGDLQRIANYIASEANIGRAIKVLHTSREEFGRLAEMPGIGHFRRDLLDKRYKFWRVYSFLVVYRWDTKPIQIIAVVHGARDLEAFFDERML